MKQFNTKYSRRGIAIEMAVMLFLAMAAVTIMIVNGTMIQIKKQQQSYEDFAAIEADINEMQLDQIGNYFIACVLKEYETFNEDDLTNLCNNVMEELTNFYGEKPFGDTEDIYDYLVKVSQPEESTIYHTLEISVNTAQIYNLTVQFVITKTESGYSVESYLVENKNVA